MWTETIDLTAEATTTMQPIPISQTQARPKHIVLEALGPHWITELIDRATGRTLISMAGKASRKKVYAAYLRQLAETKGGRS